MSYDAELTSGGIFLGKMSGIRENGGAVIGKIFSVLSVENVPGESSGVHVPIPCRITSLCVQRM